MPHLFRVIVPVSDTHRAAAFYGAVLDDVGQRVSPGRHYFDCEGTILACYDPGADGDSRASTPLPLWASENSKVRLPGEFVVRFGDTWPSTACRGQKGRSNRRPVGSAHQVLVGNAIGKS